MRIWGCSLSRCGCRELYAGAGMSQQGASSTSQHHSGRSCKGAGWHCACGNGSHRIQVPKNWCLPESRRYLTSDESWNGIPRSTNGIQVGVLFYFYFPPAPPLYSWALNLPSLLFLSSIPQDCQTHKDITGTAFWSSWFVSTVATGSQRQKEERKD